MANNSEINVRMTKEEYYKAMALTWRNKCKELDIKHNDTWTLAADLFGLVAEAEARKWTVEQIVDEFNKHLDRLKELV